MWQTTRQPAARDAAAIAPHAFESTVTPRTNASTKRFKGVMGTAAMNGPPVVTLRRTADSVGADRRSGPADRRHGRIVRSCGPARRRHDRTARRCGSVGRLRGRVVSLFSPERLTPRPALWRSNRRRLRLLPRTRRRTSPGRSPATPPPVPGSCELSPPRPRRKHVRVPHPGVAPVRRSSPRRPARRQAARPVARH